ncbi:MAG TPA: hypothetical protein VJX91_07260 [Candidatus Eisenbacteria bacterium]|nr:hypothetical protein [Candidatus Eisenbacteria bacterium]
MNRSLPALFTVLVATWVVGCGGDEEKPKQYVLRNHYDVTGFYIGPLEGGHMSLEIDQWGENPGSVAPLRPSSPLPVGLHVILTPDDGSAPIELTGYGNTSTASGGGYEFSTGSFGDGKLFGYITGPHGSGYCQGLVGADDSIEVYLGTFAGDSLHGRWNFIAPDTSVTGTFPDQTTFIGMAFDSADAYGVIFLDGYYRQSPTQPGYGVDISGFGPGSLTWSGSGLLTLDKGSASGTSSVGAWSVTRYTPPSP